MTNLLLVINAVLLLGLGQAADADVPPHYRLTVLPLTFQRSDELNNTRLPGGGINNSGQISGEAIVRSGRFSDDRAAVWQQGKPIIILDKTPVTKDKKEKDPTNSNHTFSTAINVHGAVSGGNFLTFSGAYSGILCRAFFWQGDRMQEITGFPEQCVGLAFGLNDKEWIVGSYAYNPPMPGVDAVPPPNAAGTHAFLFRNGHVLPLWSGAARGINNRGQIIGTLDSGGYNRREDKGILWQDGHTTLLAMQPAAINEHGEIAGNISVSEDNGKACIWEHGRLTYLSRQISDAYALNNRSQVVGEIGNAESSRPTHAVLWQEGQTYDLNRTLSLPRGWVLTSALGINDKGWIIGEGSIYKIPKGRQMPKSFTFLLTPQ
ncbi:MAG: hypothetical protein ACRYFS_07965 [Janthinobacterium lividum]